MKRTEPLEFHQPTSLAEATRIMLDGGRGGYFLAGGTDLVIAMKEKGLVPKYVVDLKRIPSLSGIREEADGGITIGALTTMREVEVSPLIVGRYPFLAQSAAEVGSIQIRNRATIGGNMANATPSADVAPPLLALDARARVAGAGGERVMDLKDFFRGPGQTVAEPGDILTEIMIPPQDPRLVGEYIKFSPRDMMDLAYIGVAVTLTLAEADRRCESVAIALGAVSPTPMRAPGAEAVLARPGADRGTGGGGGTKGRRGMQPHQRRAILRRVPPSHGAGEHQTRAAQRRRRRRPGTVDQPKGPPLRVEGASKSMNQAY